MRAEPTAPAPTGCLSELAGRMAAKRVSFETKTDLQTGADLPASSILAKTNIQLC